MIEGEVVSEETTFTPDLSHIPFSISRSGWCIDGHHAPNERGHGCPMVLGGKKHPDPARKGQFYITKAYRCPCACHSRDLDSSNESN